MLTLDNVHESRPNNNRMSDMGMHSNTVTMGNVISNIEGGGIRFPLVPSTAKEESSRPDTHNYLAEQLYVDFDNQKIKQEYRLPEELKAAQAKATNEGTSINGGNSLHNAGNEDLAIPKVAGGAPDYSILMTDSPVATPIVPVGTSLVSQMPGTEEIKEMEGMQEMPINYGANFQGDEQDKVEARVPAHVILATGEKDPEYSNNCIQYDQRTEDVPMGNMSMTPIMTPPIVNGQTNRGIGMDGMRSVIGLGMENMNSILPLVAPPARMSMGLSGQRRTSKTDHSPHGAFAFLPLKMCRNYDGTRADDANIEDGVGSIKMMGPPHCMVFKSGCTGVSYVCKITEHGLDDDISGKKESLEFHLSQITSRSNMLSVFTAFNQGFIFDLRKYFQACNNEERHPGGQAAVRLELDTRQSANATAILAADVTVSVLSKRKRKGKVEISREDFSGYHTLCFFGDSDGKINYCLADRVGVVHTDSFPAHTSPVVQILTTGDASAPIWKVESKILDSSKKDPQVLPCPCAGI